MKLSLCVICKDEERVIKRCIDSVKGYVDEMIVVDTGSTDNTIQIARDLGAKVFEIEWEKDFAKARNYAIDKATGNWIIFLDADEYVLEEDRKYIRNYVMEAINRKKQAIMVEMTNIGDNQVKSIFSPIRLFQNKPTIRYQGKVHEVICEENGLLEKICFKEPLRILHDGYSKDVYVDKDKLQRNLELLLLEYEKDNKDGNIRYYLIDTYKGLGKIEEACELAESSMECTGTLLGYNEMMNESLLELYIALAKPYDDIIKVYQQAIEINDTYPDFDCKLAHYFYNLGMYEESIKHLKLCLQKIEKYTGVVKSTVVGNVFTEYRILANSYIMSGRDSEAVPVLIKVLRIDKYEYSSLYNLISIVGKVERAENLGLFLEKLYDIYNTKDQEVLKVISEKVGNYELMSYFQNRIKEIV